MHYQQWLEICYHINGKNFNGFQAYESIPLKQFLGMAQIHMKAIEAERKAIAESRKKK